MRCVSVMRCGRVRRMSVGKYVGACGEVRRDGGCKEEWESWGRGGWGGGS